MNKYKLSIFDPQAAKLLENITIDKSDFQLQLEEKIENVKEINVSQAAALPASDDEGQFSSSSSSEANQATVEPEKSLEVENLREQAAVASENEEENLEESSPKPNLIFCKYCQIYIPQNEYRQHFKSETCQQNQKKIYENSDNFIGQNETKEPSIKTNLNNVNLETIPSDFQNNPNRLTKYDIQRSQKLFLRAHFRHEFDDQRVTPGPLITIYRHVVSPKGELPTHAELISRIKNLHEDKNQKILILLHAGGHFAIALYNNGECIKHKTFRAYIVRGKAGGVQAQADKRQGAHKSVGAQLRRTNQVHFEEKISTLLKSWKEENIFTECSLKLLHVPHYARKLYFNDHAFDKEDTSVRSIPFSTVKPGMAECSRVFTELFSLCIWSNNEIETVKLKKKVAHGSPKLDLEALRISSVADCDITQEEVLNINKQKKSEYQNLKKLKTLENTISSDEEELRSYS